MFISGQAFLQSVVHPALVAIGLSTPSADRLVLATAVHESGGLVYKVQQGNGVALGYFQMQPATVEDIWQNVLSYNGNLRSAVSELLNPDDGSDSKRRTKALLSNDKYAAAMCRVEYFRFEKGDPLPTDPNDIPGLAAYWKRHYNTYLGHGKIIDFIQNWNRHMNIPDAVTNTLSHENKTLGDGLSSPSNQLMPGAASIPTVDIKQPTRGK